MPIIYVRDENGKFVPIRREKSRGAYECAVAGGFVGTYEEFCRAIAELTPNAELTPLAKHLSKTDNPHKVTAKQAGAIPEVYYFSSDLNTEIAQGGNKMTVCYYNTSTLNTPYTETVTDYAHGMVITNAHTEQYGTQLCIPSGDNNMYLRRFNKQGITNWSKISPEDIANAVKKTGDTMTGAITVKKPTAWGQFIAELNGHYRSFEADDVRMRLDVRDEADTNNRRFLDLYSNLGEDDFANALKIAEVKDGAVTTATLLHTKNKPSGTYTGTGQSRAIRVGGIGSALLVTGVASYTHYAAIVTSTYAIYIHRDTVGNPGGVGVDTSITYKNGVLSIPDRVLNYSDATYSYQVL